MVPLTFYTWEKVAQRPVKTFYKELPITIAEHLRKKRVLSRHTQQHVAELFGVTEDTITHWETGYSEPQVMLYPAIIAYLGYYPFEPETSTVSGKLLYIRNTHGYTYKELALLFGVHASTVRSWELNNHKPNAEKLRLIEQLYRP